ncbi:MAG: 50S ribosomal protein L10 [Bacteroidetes bacterium]|nr:50S ribosomal protein L10 [Bacteroidota bacterium]
MTKEQKTKVINELSAILANTSFYLADTGGMTVQVTNRLRRDCFKQGISMLTAKNTLIKKALEKTGKKELSGMTGVLNGSTSIFFSGIPVAPAKVIKNFRKKEKKPLLKAAFIEESVYLGDDQLNFLANLKSKNELIADIVLSLKSPAMNVINALLSGKNKLAGIVKTLSEKPDA